MTEQRRYYGEIRGGEGDGFERVVVFVRAGAKPNLDLVAAAAKLAAMRAADESKDGQ